MDDLISSLLWYKFKSQEEKDEKDEEREIIFEQFVHGVEDFSSQYGSEISISYTAFNIRGPPSNFPDYGDYPQAFVMVRNYTLFSLFLFGNLRSVALLVIKFQDLSPLDFKNKMLTHY